MKSLPTDDIRVMFDNNIGNDDIGLTVEEVEDALLKNREHFECLFYEIQTVIVLFSEDCTIMPMQCRGAVKSLENAQQNARHLHKLLDRPDRLPIIFSALHYRLVFQIHLIEKQAEQLIGFIESYRAICTSTAGSVQRRKHIYRTLKMLSEAIADVSEQTKFMKREARFHQKKLAAIGKITAINDTLEERASDKKQSLCLFAQHE